MLLLTPLILLSQFIMIPFFADYNMFSKMFFFVESF